MRRRFGASNCAVASNHAGTELQIELQELGGRLKAEREQRGLSQLEVAQRSGITRVSQSRYEIGLSVPSLTYFAQVANAGLDVHNVIFGRKAAGCIWVDDENIFGHAIEAVNQFFVTHALEASPLFRAEAVRRANALFQAGRDLRLPLTVGDLLDRAP
jgi:transcriptional regulator with XRE-family HTH domain